METIEAILTLTLVFSRYLVTCNGGTVSFLDTQVEVSEGYQFDLGIKHTGTIEHIVNVIVRVDNTNEDFVASTMLAAFVPGGSSVAKVTFMVRDDDDPEEDETYTFTLMVISPGATVNIPNKATVIIPANDDAYGVFCLIDDSTIYIQENPSFETVANIEVGRTGGTYGIVTVFYKVESLSSSGIVGDRGDISPDSGYVTFFDSDTHALIQLNVRTDVIPENDEAFRLTLTGATKDARVLDSEIIIVIKANDAPIRFSKKIFHFCKGPKTKDAILTLHRGLDMDGVTPLGFADGIVNVGYRLISLSRSQPDYSSVNDTSNGQVIFQPGVKTASITLPATDESSLELEQSYQIVLTSISGDDVLKEPYDANVYINDNTCLSGAFEKKEEEDVFQ